MPNHIGQRLSFQGDRCTVWFIGKIEGKDGDWLGVEWDDDQKGKHGGIVNGRRYFDCKSSSPTAGSFIRPSRKPDQPLSFLEALKQKYILSESANDAIHIGGKTVEEVGFEKIQSHIQNFQRLPIIILNGRCICVNQHLKASEANEIRSLQLQIRDLDLSQNLFEIWDDVYSICTALEHLRRLNVAGNRFSDTTFRLTDKPPWKTTLSIETLSLADTLLSWEKIVTLAAGLPALKSLNASGNNISCISQPLRHSRVSALNLASNQISSLKDIASLSELLNLEELSLGFNPLNDVESKLPVPFTSLQRLDLSGTNLSGLKSLDSIPQVFPALKFLQTKNTPLSKVDSATLHTIARLPNLIELNHSTISAEERQNAELFYLGTIVKELEIASDEAEEANTLRNHPMWDALCKIHGTPTVRKAAANAINPNSLEARIIVFTFYISSSPQDNVQKEDEKQGKLFKTETTNSDFQQNDSKNNIPNAKASTSETNPNPSKSMINPTSTHKSTLPQPTAPPPPRAKITPSKSTPIPRTTSCYALQGIVGRLFALPPPFTTTIRLFHETDEWDPVAGVDGRQNADNDDDGWSVSEDEDEDEDGPSGEEERMSKKEKKKGKGKMIMRTEELVPSMRPVGDWVSGRTARVKVVVLV